MAKTKELGLTKAGNPRKRPARPAEGAPSKYKPEYCQALVDHFEAEPYTERELTRTRGQGESKTVEVYDVKLIPNRVPSLTKFAKINNICWQSVHNWIDPKHGSYHAEFLDAYTHARALRANMLVDMGMSGVSPPASFKFVAVNLTDMRDKTETKHEMTGWDDYLAWLNSK